MLSSQVQFSSGWHVLSDISRSQWNRQLKGKKQMDEVRHASKREQLPSIENKNPAIRGKEFQVHQKEKGSAAAVAAQNSKVPISSGQTRPILQDRGDHASLEKIPFPEMKDRLCVYWWLRRVGEEADVESFMTLVALTHLEKVMFPISCSFHSNLKSTICCSWWMPFIGDGNVHPPDTNLSSPAEAY